MLLIVIGILAYGSWQTALWVRRPMFYHQFRRHDGTTFYRWWPELPCEDHRGNAAIADYRLNLLVVFLTGGRHIHPVERFMYPRLGPNGVTFPAQLREDTMDFFVPTTTDTVFVFAADGSSQKFPLSAGEAQRIHSEMRYRPPNVPEDLAAILESAYTQRHVPGWAERLRQTIAKSREN